MRMRTRAIGSAMKNIGSGPPGSCFHKLDADASRCVRTRVACHLARAGNDETECFKSKLLDSIFTSHSEVSITACRIAAFRSPDPAPLPATRAPGCCLIFKCLRLTICASSTNIGGMPVRSINTQFAGRSVRASGVLRPLLLVLLGSRRCGRLNG